MPKAKTIERSILILLTISVWTSVYLLAKDKMLLTARAPMSISVLTVPPTIRLRVDGKYHTKGHLSTPLKFDYVVNIYA